MFSEKDSNTKSDLRDTTTKPDLSLKRRIIQYLDLFDSKDTLLIVYYAGHGSAGRNPGSSSLWFADSSDQSPSLPSGGVQSLLEEAEGDVLILLDCCHSAATAGSALYTSINGVKEVISACGYESTALAVGAHSFTKALVEVLTFASEDLPITVGEIHSQVLNHLKCWVPSLEYGENGRLGDDEGNLTVDQAYRLTPVYTIISASTLRRSIVLHVAKSTEGSPMSTLSSSPSTDINTNDSTVLHTKLRQQPQIILAVNLQEDNFDHDKWVEWIKSAPKEAREISIEGKYKSFSTLLLLKMPVSIWDMLADNPAYKFVGFVRPRNGIQDLGPSLVPYD